MVQLTDQQRRYLYKLTDLRMIGQIAFVVIVLWISWSGVNIIHTNYQLQQKIAREQQENEITKLKNENQKLKNDYYNSPQYLELSARQNFGLAAPGEKELLVPKEVALAHIPPNVDVSSDSQAAHKSSSPFFARNLQAWFDFFLHRSEDSVLQ